jgi:hypothetical protein
MGRFRIEQMSGCLDLRASLCDLQRTRWMRICIGLAALRTIGQTAQWHHTGRRLGVHRLTYKGANKDRLGYFRVIFD